jgi:hypothetical protein
MLKKLALIAALACMSAVASASSFTGTIVNISTQLSVDGTNITRVSIHTGAATSCVFGWYAFQYASNGAGQGPLWAAQLLDALLTQESITIQGTGVCDAYNIETINWIQSN